ncbi:MAG: hypothetical protein EBS64_07050 [Verrucomicrobia bacterium]|nr:hypothetical protein [Verrucomicrobiota bacterium]
MPTATATLVELTAHEAFAYFTEQVKQAHAARARARHTYALRKAENRIRHWEAEKRRALAAIREG